MSAESKPLVLKDLLSRDFSLPICPEVFVRLTAVITDESKTVSDLSQVLLSDPALTAQVLRISNSAYFGVSRQIHSIEEAVFRIGFKGVWTVAAVIKAQEACRGAAGEWTDFNENLWQHSTKTAAFAYALSKRLNPLYVDVYFTAGLLHDIGKLILNQLAPSYASICSNGLSGGYDLVWHEMELFGTHHAKLGAELLTHWDLPEVIVELVSFHHEPPAKDDSLRLSRRILTVANEMAHAAELSQTISTIDTSVMERAGLLGEVGLNIEACASVGADAQQRLAMMNLV